MTVWISTKVWLPGSIPTSTWSSKALLSLLFEMTSPMCIKRCSMGVVWVWSLVVGVVTGGGVVTEGGGVEVEH